MPSPTKKKKATKKTKSPSFKIITKTEKQWLEKYKKTLKHLEKKDKEEVRKIIKRVAGKTHKTQVERELQEYQTRATTAEIRAKIKKRYSSTTDR